MSSCTVQTLTLSSIFGRIIPGALADKVGKFNMQAFWSYVAGILVLSLGIAASSNAAYITYAAFYGFASGAWVALLPSQIASISKVEQIGTRLGVIFATISFGGLIGNPVAGQIIIKNKGEFWGLNVFAGVILVSGASFYLFARMRESKWKVFVKV